MTKRSLLLAGVASWVMLGTALADDLTVSTGIQRQVKTSAANNGTPGNISITDIGTITYNAAGATVTLDSNNVVNNVGTIANTAASDAIGVHMIGGNTGGFTSSGSVILSGTVANNTAILIDGAGTFVGSATSGSLTNVALETGPNGVITVYGDNATGVAIKTPVTGAVLLQNAFSIFGKDAIGFISTAPIDGTLASYSSMSIGGTTTPSNTGFDPETKYGFAVGASVTGGLLLGGPIDEFDATQQSTISVSGSRPAIYISPKLAGASAADLVLGEVVDSNTPGYNFINRGNAFSDGNDPGINATALRIEGDGVHQVSLNLGMYNRGIISAQASSSNLSASQQPAAAADATGVAIGAGATVKTLYNQGTLAGTSVGSKGGTGTGLLIEAGGSLESLTNVSFISGSSIVNDSTLNNVAAYGVRDLSGTLKQVTNAGSITATGTTTDSGSTFVAVDISHSSLAENLDNQGTVTGNVKFGSGANKLTMGTSTAILAGRISKEGAGTLDVNIAAGTLQTDNAQVTNLTVGSAGKVKFALGLTTVGAPLVAASGNINFEAGSTLTVTPVSFLPDSGTYTIMTAGGTLTFGDFNASTVLPVPFLFTGGFSKDTHDLKLTLTRKSAAALGLTGNSAIIYEAAADAAAQDNEYGAAMLTLANIGDVKRTLNSLMPSIGNGVRALTVALTDQAMGPIGARQRGLVSRPKEALSFWTQQFYEDLNQSTSLSSTSYFGSGQGASAGVEWGNTAKTRYGAGYTFFAGQVTESNPRTTKADVILNMFSLYGGWKLNNFFLTPQANFGFAQFTGHRIVTVAGIERTASAKWNAYLASGGLTTGYQMNFGPVQIIPQISLDGFWMHQNGYSESGAGNGANLRLGAQDLKSVRLFAGVVAQSEFDFDGGDVQPQVMAGWSHEFQTKAPVIDAAFEALPGSPFALVGPTSDPSKMIGGASVAYIFENWSAGVNYDASQDQNSLQQSATVTITSKF